MFQFTEEVVAGDFDLVADTFHCLVRQAVQCERIQSLSAVVPIARANPEFSQEQPFGLAFMQDSLEYIEQEGGAPRAGWQWLSQLRRRICHGPLRNSQGLQARNRFFLTDTWPDNEFEGDQVLQVYRVAFSFGG